MITDLGAYNNEGDQRAYFKQYLPPGFLDTDLEKAVASRAGYWLHGRYGFTATYLSRLLQNTFGSPHTVLNDFVHGMTGFWPSDYNDNPFFTVELEKPCGYDFSGLLKESHKKPGLLITAATFMFQYTITGEIRGLSGPNGDSMVDYGVSRFKPPSIDGSGVAETDEPLAILALVIFLAKQHLTLEKHLLEALSTMDLRASGLAFEPFSAYLLARAFSTPRPLSEVFEFVGTCELQGETAELVTLGKSNGTFKYTPFDVNSDSRLGHVPGYSPLTTNETLKWLQNPQGSAFYFPPSAVGPVLIFVLRLTSDDTFLRVCVQFRHTNESLFPWTTKTIRGTEPPPFPSMVQRRRVDDV
ncbi:hypothetical protein FRC17_000410 [Serendipita sp. 399]|nr:hypothetical protein FRC17_000410 [Serendipita sp. 399]